MPDAIDFERRRLSGADALGLRDHSDSRRNPPERGVTRPTAVLPVRSVVIAGDIGGPDGYHAGDEAMFAANVAWLRALRADVEITAISRDPDWTARRYGVDAVPLIGFPAFS